MRKLAYQLSAFVVLASPCTAAPVRFDFANAQAVSRWTAQHDVSSLRATAKGMAIAIKGSDPYISGPAADYPAETTLWLDVKLLAPASGMAQVFWFSANRGPNEQDSVRFPVEGGKWCNARVPVPSLGKGTRLRFDPPGDKGTVTLARIELTRRETWKEPAWPKPPVTFKPAFAEIQSGELEIRQSAGGAGAFSVRVDGTQMAVGHSRPLIGYVSGGKARWLDVNRAGKEMLETSGKNVARVVRVRDANGGVWTIRERFIPLPRGGAVKAYASVTCSRPRDVLYLPMLMLLPGAGTFGVHKNQALFSGLEYLDGDEPSSSEKDIVGPGAKRRVPDSAKITQPLMVLQQSGRYVGLIWKPSSKFSAVFDSPDRTFKSGGHAMGVIFPGSDGSNREEGSLLPYGPVKLKAGETVTLEATIIGGKGDSVVPAVRQYVAMNRVPPTPDTGLSWEGCASLVSAGWLDSGIRQGGLYAHAYPGSFKPQPAADAAMWMDWLSTQTSEKALSARLSAASAEALTRVPESELNQAGVGHVRYPAPALVYGKALESVKVALREGRDTLKRFQPDGTVLYVKRAETPDLGRTHFAKDANGLTADAVVRVLEAAVYTGSAELRTEGLRVLDALAKFENTAPRGAQTWEVPLHTPDILASANLVKAYVLGYELTRDTKYLEQAKYWAWTGVPFVYLVPPVDRPVGPYGTIAVYGATQWVAPNWMGLPVQWCGLVYADALYSLARFDSSGPWMKLSDGIAASGIQQTHPVGVDPKRQGLLPDSFNLHGQIRNDVAINPATLLPSALRAYGRMPVYERLVLPKGLIVHAPGKIEKVDYPGGVEFSVRPWAAHPCQVLIVGLKSAPKSVSVNGEDPDAEYDATTGALAITISGLPDIRIQTE